MVHLVIYLLLDIYVVKGFLLLQIATMTSTPVEIF